MNCAAKRLRRQWLERRRLRERIAQSDEPLFRRIPTGSARLTVDERINLVLGETGSGGEESNVHSPFVFRRTPNPHSHASAAAS
jgi:hypothetical protein